MHNDESLIERYIDILKGHERLLSLFGKGGYSDLFLAGCSEGYFEAKNKVMIVGRETRGWNVKGDSSELSNYITLSMNKSNRWLGNQLLKKTNDKGRAFFNFVRSVSKKVGKDGIVWTNTFCVSLNKTIPLKGSDTDSSLIDLSIDLLRLQINHYQPDIIIFAGGGRSVETRRKCIPMDKCLNHVDYEHSVEKVPNKYLWQFDLQEIPNYQLKKLIRCYRIFHPSSKSQDAIRAEKFLLEKVDSYLKW